MIPVNIILMISKPYEFSVYFVVGYRHFSLLNKHGDKIPMALILLKVEIKEA